MRGIRSALVLILAGTGAAAAQSTSLLEGLRQFRQGDYTGAELSFQNVLKNGENPTAQTFLALIQSGTGRCGAAIPALTKSFSSDRTELQRLSGLALAQCQIHASKTDAAFRTIERLQSLYPNDADVLYQSAKFYMTAWNQTMRELFERNPASFRVNQLSAEVFETQSKFDAAIEEYRKALAKSPKTVGLHFRLGRAILMQSHEPAALTGAQAEFEAELALNPRDAAAEYEIAQVLLARQKPDEALPRLERAAELAPDFPEALIALAKCRAEHGENAAAVPLLERAVKLTPGSAPAHLALMMAYRNAGRMQDAQAQKEIVDRLMKPPEGEFTEFLKKLGEDRP
jgi:tetratricopeptide (TPR) repeat protein